MVEWIALGVGAYLLSRKEAPAATEPKKDEAPPPEPSPESGERKLPSDLTNAAPKIIQDAAKVAAGAVTGYVLGGVLVDNAVLGTGASKVGITLGIPGTYSIGDTGARIGTAVAGAGVALATTGVGVPVAAAVVAVGVGIAVYTTYEEGRLLAQITAMGGWRMLNQVIRDDLMRKNNWSAEQAQDALDWINVNRYLTFMWTQKRGPFVDDAGHLRYGLEHGFFQGSAVSSDARVADTTQKLIYRAVGYQWRTPPERWNLSKAPGYTGTVYATAREYWVAQGAKNGIKG